MDQNNINDTLRNAAEKPSENAWNQLDKQLNEDSKPSIRKIFNSPFSIAAAMAVLVISSFFLFKINEEESSFKYAFLELEDPEAYEFYRIQKQYVKFLEKDEKAMN